MAFLDTGSSISLISDNLLSENVLSNHLMKYSNVVLDASGNVINILGKIRVNILTPVGNFIESLLVYDSKSRFLTKLLIGMNIIKHFTIDFPSGRVLFSIPVSKVTPKRQAEVTLKFLSNIIQNKGSINGISSYGLKVTGKSPENSGSQKAVLHNSGRHEVTEKQEVTESESNEPDDNRSSEVFSVHLRETIVLQSNSVNILSIVASKGLMDEETICIHSNELRQGILVANVMTVVKNGHLLVNCVNYTDQPVVLSQGTHLSYANVMHESTVNTLQTVNSKDTVLNDDLRPLTVNDINCDVQENKGEIVQLLNDYRKICWLPGERLGHYKDDPMPITLKEEIIINKAPYPIPHAKREQLNNEISEMLRQGIISRSSSSFNSPLIIVAKPFGKIRPCIDYRALNKVTIPISFPIPRISDLLNSLSDTTVISSLDLASAYNQLDIKVEDRPKTAFTVGNTKYCFNRVAFGLVNSPSHFSRIINNVLFDVLGDNVMAYMDDILIHTKDMKSHLERLEQVLKCLQKANIKLKIEKCHFCTSQTKFLGYKITQKGMEMDQERTQAIRNMPNPESKKALQAFLGVTNYYRSFVRNYAHVAEPLYSLLRKDVKYTWKEEQARAVNELKDALCNAPILKFPDFGKEFHLHTDSSATGIGACLLQEHKGILHPVSYVSKCLNMAQRNYSTTKREALALVFALEKFRTLILHYKVIAYTDHLPLTGVLNKPTKDACLNRWALLVQEYGIQLQYLPGKRNLFADALSRLSDVKENCDEIPEELDAKLTARINALQSYIPEKVPWTEEKLRKEQRNDKKCTELKKSLQKNDTERSTSITKFRILKGILYVLRTVKRGSVSDEFLVPYIPESMMDDAFKLVHRDLTAGHSGVERTLKTFRKNFYNNFESKIISELCAKCIECIRAKGVSRPIPLGLYPIPQKPFTTISADLLGPLSVTARGNKYILVARDFTTRYSVLCPLVSKEANNVIEALRNIFSHYGPSEVLLTDNGTEFVGEQVKRFCSFFNVKKVEIVPYHASSQGLAERMNQEVTKLLRIYSQTIATVDWDEFLPTVQLCINNTFNASVGETPFYLVYGYDSPSSVFNQPKLNYREDDLSTHLARVVEIRRHCRETLLKSQAQYTRYANTNRQNKDIVIGQRVFARLGKIIPHTKLDMPVTGPLQVIGQKGKGFQLKDLQSGNTYTVHPDCIILQHQTPDPHTPAEAEAVNPCNTPAVQHTPVEEKPKVNHSYYTPPPNNGTIATSSNPTSTGKPKLAENDTTSSSSTDKGQRRYNLRPRK